MKKIILFVLIISTSISLSAKMCSFTIVDEEEQIFKEGCSENSKQRYSDKTCQEAAEYINRCGTVTVTFGVKVKKDSSVDVSGGKVIK